jgi:PAS domain S-box-containing protein
MGLGVFAIRASAYRFEGGTDFRAERHQGVNLEERRTIELSERERQIVDLAAEGHTDTSIAHTLGISEATVSTYWSRVRMKIGPYSRPELIGTIIRSTYTQIVQDLKDQNKELVGKLERATGEEWGDTDHNFYHELLNQAPDAIVVVNENGILEMVNEEAATLFGYSKEELAGAHLNDLLPDRYRRVHEQHRREFMQSPSRRHMNDHSISLALDKTGREFSVAATLSPVKTVSGTHVMCILREAPRYAQLHVESTEPAERSGT